MFNVSKCFVDEHLRISFPEYCKNTKVDSGTSFSLDFTTETLNASTYSYGDFSTESGTYDCWDYWSYYYLSPYYPVDVVPDYKKSILAYKIIKNLNDKGLFSIKRVEDFIKTMNALIEIL